MNREKDRKKIIYYAGSRGNSKHKHEILKMLKEYNIPFEMISYGKEVSEDVVRHILRYSSNGLDGILMRNAVKNEELMKLIRGNVGMNQIISYLAVNPYLLSQNIFYIPHNGKLLVGKSKSNMEEIISDFNRHTRKLRMLSYLAQSAQVLGIGDEYSEGE